MKRMLSVLLAALLMLTGCAGPGGESVSQRLPGGSEDRSKVEGAPAPVRYALSEPVYPDFPKQPRLPEEFDEKDWDVYMENYDRYMDALLAIRGEQSGLPEEERAAVQTFAAKSLPLVLAGHEGENTIYSPLSLWSALAMLSQCAGGNSRRQVLNAIGAQDTDSLQELAEHIWRTLYTDDGVSALLLANSVWLNSNLQGVYVQDTLDTLARKYYAGAYSVPMGTGEADRAVTDWVKKQTNGLIGGDQPVVKTRPETLALLVSSLYYRAAWTDEFLESRTQEDTFTDAAGNESKADFMHKTQDANFIRRDGWQAAALGTELGEMVFVLPDAGISPEFLLQAPEFLSGLDFQNGSIWGEVQWSVPKFDVNSDLDLKSTLAALEITDLLDLDTADLTALTDLDAFLSEARQLARVKVDEHGVEAAAVTYMAAAGACMPPEDPEICVMDLNRPFLFVIRTQGVPLFVGIVNQVQA